MAEPTPEPTPKPPKSAATLTTASIAAAGTSAMEPGAQPESPTMAVIVVKPPARRARVGSNLSAQGLPASFEAVKQLYTANAACRTVTAVIDAPPLDRGARAQYGDLMTPGATTYYGQTAPGATTYYGQTAPGATTYYGQTHDYNEILGYDYGQTHGLDYGQTHGYGHMASTQAPYRLPQARVLDEADDQNDSMITDLLDDFASHDDEANQLSFTADLAVDRMENELKAIKKMTHEDLMSMRDSIQQIATQVSTLREGLIAEIKGIINRSAGVQ